MKKFILFFGLVLGLSLSSCGSKCDCANCQTDECCSKCSVIETDTTETTVDTTATIDSTAIDTTSN